jgi:hypothetical protein
MSACAASSVASGLALGGITTAIAAECCRCAAAAVGITTVVALRAFVWWDCPALEREVTSCSDPCPWPKG